MQLAHAGPREALVALPETIRPTIGSVAEASIYGSNGKRGTARLRQISDSADAQTRTYEARYVLEGDAASAPLGATVTIRLADSARQSDVSVPIGAVFDDGNRTGVWLLDRDATTVHFAPVKIKRLGEETAVVSGIEVGQPVVALGAHLTKRGRERQNGGSGGGVEQMSFNLSAIAVRERAVTLFFIALLAAAGAYAFVKLGRAEDPSFTIKTF